MTQELLTALVAQVPPLAFPEPEAQVLRRAWEAQQEPELQGLQKRAW
ncbi:hypothetical protein NXS98_05245 [Fontisphaera persica]|nr:hypothetical protein [Fontisphaera persica]WCJ60536.1 hypothetical protein NXS98_05245 [Fontisphaera persica]